MSKIVLIKRQRNGDSLESTLQELRERFGEGAVMRLGEVRKVNVDVIPTGSPSLDLALGVGGVAPWQELVGNLWIHECFRTKLL